MFEELGFEINHSTIKRGSSSDTTIGKCPCLKVCGGGVASKAIGLPGLVSD